VQRLVPQVYSLLELLRIERPPLAAANTPSIRQCRLRGLLETWRSNFVWPVRRLIPACAARALSGLPFIRDAADEPFRLMGCSVGPEGGYCMVCEVLDGG